MIEAASLLEADGLGLGSPLNDADEDYADEVLATVAAVEAIDEEEAGDDDIDDDDDESGAKTSDDDGERTNDEDDAKAQARAQRRALADSRGIVRDPVRAARLRALLVPAPGAKLEPKDAAELVGLMVRQGSSLPRGTGDPQMSSRTTTANAAIVGNAREYEDGRIRHRS